MKQNKKEEKTINNIYEAFIKLLKEGDYNSINSSKLIEESKISRSTFYSHFKNKEDLIIKLINKIFNHVYSSGLTKEKDHDYSLNTVFDYKDIITHIFYHFKDENDLIKTILDSTAKQIFIDSLNEKVNLLMTTYYNSLNIKNPDVPKMIKINNLTTSLTSLLAHYSLYGAKSTPEEMTKYFFILNK